MSVLIGGSGSTGSSLLRQILNRNSALFCGPETSLFCKASLFDNWSSHKSKLLNRGYRGLRSNSWHIYRGTDLLKKEAGHTEDGVRNLVKNSSSFSAFANAYFESNLENTGSSMWLEKTPGNVYNFSRFLKAFPDGKIIHIYRNPYDTIASLVSRGFSHYYATGIYLLNTSFGLSQRGNPNYTELSYENLVSDTEETVMNICRFLKVNYRPEMLMPSKDKYDDDPSQIGKWTYDERGEIESGSIGKFDSLSSTDQELIISATHRIQIISSLAHSEKLSCKKVEEICAALKYPFKTEENSDSLTQLKSQRQKDLVIRTKKMAYYNFLNYPLTLITD
jgi:hypothetical protein